MIRGSHVDATVIGAFEVDQNANIANWIIPNGKQLGVGGAMDLVSGVKKVIVAMQHTTKNGKPKIVKKCSLPITGIGEADMVVTELAVFYFDNDRLVLKEIAPEISLENLKDVTEAEFTVSSDLKKIEV
jgi:3-oxoacid CoA-transferase B subunit